MIVPTVQRPDLTEWELAQWTKPMVSASEIDWTIREQTPGERAFDERGAALRTLKEEDDMPVDFAARRQEAEKAGLLGKGDYLKLKEGANRLRLMSECLPHAGEYKGTKNFKWLCYVLDRADGKVKPMFMPHTIYKQIEGLQTDEDYGFYDVPMPYDIVINAKGAGTKEVEYTVIPRKHTKLTPDELGELAQAKPLQELQAKLREKQTGTGPAHGDDDHSGPIDDDHVPF